MSNETIALLGLLVAILGLVVGFVGQVFGQDIRKRLIGAFGQSQSEPEERQRQTAGHEARQKRSRWLLVPLGILALISLALLLKSISAAPEPNPYPVGDAPGSELDLMNMVEAPGPISKAPVPPPTTQQAEPALAGPFDWSQFKGDVPIWYRTSRDSPLSLYVDAASVEVPTPDTREFWAVGIPPRTTEGFQRVAYMKAKYTADCSRKTLSMRPPLLYDNDGRTIEYEEQGATFADREAAPGTNGRIALRFVCSGPNENSVEVLRGGNLAKYLVPNITRAPQ